MKQNLIFTAAFVASFAFGNYLTPQKSVEVANQDSSEVFNIKDEVKVQNKVVKKAEVNVEKSKKVKPVIVEAPIVHNVRDEKRVQAIKDAMKENSSSYIESFLYHADIQTYEDEIQAENVYDDEVAKNLENLFKRNLQENPEKLFDSLKVAAEMLDESPVEQALVFEKMAMIPGQTEVVKTLIKENLKNVQVEPEKKPEEIKSKKEEIKNYGQSDKQIAYEKNHETLQKLTDDPEERFRNTIEVFDEQKNENVQRNIASNFLERDEDYAEDLVEEIGIEKSNRLVPNNIEIKKNEYGVIEVWDHVEPIEKL